MLYKLHRNNSNDKFMIYEVDNNYLVCCYPWSEDNPNYQSIKNLIDDGDASVSFVTDNPTESISWRPENSILDAGETASIHRQHRDILLTESDWTQMPDSPLTDEAKALWATYRTALRDISSHANWPYLNEADWPVKP